MRRVPAWFVLLSPMVTIDASRNGCGSWQSGGVYDIDRTIEEE